MLTLALFIVISCKKSDDAETGNTAQEYALSADVAVAQNTVVSGVSLFLTRNSDAGLKDASGSCPAVSSNPTTGYPRTYTIDFGTSGCTFGGSTIYGKIIGNASAKINSANTQITVTFENFKVDTVQISGTINLKVNSFSLSGTALDVTSTFTDLSVTTPSGTFKVSGSQTIVWKWNATPTMFEDDTFDINTGSTLSGTDRSGAAYTANVTTTVVYKTLCMEPVSGVLQVVPANTKLGSTSIDFGTGTCDGTITIITKAKTYSKTI